MAAKKTKPVWKRKAPAGAKHARLSPQKKALAKASAKRAGRPYPNLVDNLRVAKQSASGKKPAAGKRRPRSKVARKKTVRG